MSKPKAKFKAFADYKNDYATLERSWPGKIMVATLRMLPERLTVEWLKTF
jgi:hypothetical protein